jgi:hypothetical protein
MKMTTIGYPISHLDTNLRKGTTFLLQVNVREYRRVIKNAQCREIGNTRRRKTKQNHDTTQITLY